MNGLLLIVALVMFAGILIITPADGAPATLVALPLAAIVGGLIYWAKIDHKFLIRLFIAGLLARIVVGTMIFVFQQQTFFGGDAFTFDFFGNALLKTWEGDKYFQTYVDVFSGGGASSGWGMLYMVAVIYKLVGRNLLATQYVNSVLGAATAPLAYMIALEIFPNKRVARVCALLTAFFPSMVLWTSQGLKDGPIIFLLILSMLATLKLGTRFSFKYLTALALSLVGLVTLRFYVFYIILISITGAFVMGRRRLTAQSFARQLIIMFVIGGALAFFGVSRLASRQFESYGNLQQLQVMRADASQSAQSGFGQDIDVSTPTGALAAIPVGLTYLILAPFPWQLTSIRQMITLPEMMIWWSSIPLLVLGLWFTLKHRLREITPILIFTSLLTLSYSILQGNVGTAYRQRAQLLVFYFVFVAIGFVLVQEKREEKARRRKEAAKAGSHAVVRFARENHGPRQPANNNSRELV
jgi:4-amino-4-deoxy-L-arabinose transferase-like glycosyltransferase